MKHPIFQAAVLERLNAPLAVKEISLPSIIQPGNIVVRVLTTAVCGSQVGEIAGIKGEDRFLPHLLGHEAVVEIVDPLDSKLFKVGDKALAHWIKGVGRSGGPIHYSSESGVINAGEIATFSQFAVISENRLTKIPESLCEEFGLSLLATIGCAFLTAFGIIENNLGYDQLDQVLLIGGGGVSQAMITLLKSMDKPNIFVIEKSNARQRYLENLGVNNIFSNFDEIRGAKLSFSGVVDFSGQPREIELGFECLSKIGTLALVGVTPLNQKISIDPMPLHYGKKIIGVFGGNSKPTSDIHRILDLLRARKDLLKLLAFESLPLRDINQGIELVRNAVTPGRVILDFLQ